MYNIYNIFNSNEISSNTRLFGIKMNYYPDDPSSLPSSCDQQYWDNIKAKSSYNKNQFNWNNSDSQQIKDSWRLLSCNDIQTKNDDISTQSGYFDTDLPHEIISSFNTEQNTNILPVRDVLESWRLSKQDKPPIRLPPGLIIPVLLQQFSTINLKVELPISKTNTKSLFTTCKKYKKMVTRRKNIAGHVYITPKRKQLVDQAESDNLQSFSKQDSRSDLNEHDNQLGSEIPLEIRTQPEMNKNHVNANEFTFQNTSVQILLNHWGVKPLPDSSDYCQPDPGYPTQDLRSQSGLCPAESTRGVSLETEPDELNSEPKYIQNVLDRSWQTYKKWNNTPVEFSTGSCDSTLGVSRWEKYNIQNASYSNRFRVPKQSLDDVENLRDHLYKTQLCVNSEKCFHKSTCRFAHNMFELRVPLCIYKNNCKKQTVCKFCHPSENKETYYNRVKNISYKNSSRHSNR